MWRSSLRLGALLSVTIGIAGALLVGRISDQTLVGGAFLVASVLGWANVARFDHEPRTAAAPADRA